jgi:hypothetical protein
MDKDEAVLFVGPAWLPYLPVCLLHFCHVYHSLGSVICHAVEVHDKNIYDIALQLRCLNDFIANWNVATLTRYKQVS